MREDKIFDLVHIDVWGPYSTPSTTGDSYFLTLVDDYSRAVWVFMFSSKTQVADLVTDTPERINVLNYLRNIKKRDEMDIIIALGMAKEGFDWPWCEHALTIGYRASLTEVVQIIGRATRDCEGKTHAQFTNLIAQPDAEDEHRDHRDAGQPGEYRILRQLALPPRTAAEPEAGAAPLRGVRPGQV